MINDRGTKKWTSIMLPEHIKMLQKLSEEQNQKEKPILDEQQIQENELKLRGSLEHKLEIRVTYFMDHDFQLIEGTVKYIRNKTILLDNGELNFDDIAEVEFMNSIFDPY